MRRTVAVIVILVLLVSLSLGAIHVSHFYKERISRALFSVPVPILDIIGVLITDFQNNIIETSIILSTPSNEHEMSSQKTLTIDEAKEILSVIPKMQSKYKESAEFSATRTVIYIDKTGSDFMQFSDFGLIGLRLKIGSDHVTLFNPQIQEFIQKIKKAIEWIEALTKKLQNT